MAEENKKDKKSSLDKVLMGAIIGGAIGSVVGATLAPKKGKETRKNITEIAKRATKESGNIIKKIIFFVKRKKKIPNEHV
jgi:gas vesicle protein